MDFDGMIRDARIWDVTHNEAEVAFYQYFSSENAAGLVAHWPLNEGLGTVLSDISGKNNDATLNEGSWSSQSYSFAWSDGPDTEDRENLSSGSYTVAVTDEFGCTVSETFLVETTTQYGPGGVTHDLAVWLRADKNVYSQSPADPASHDDPVELWKGFSTSWIAEQPEIIHRPAYATSDAWQLNYNGYLAFDGQDDELTLDRSSEGLEEQHTLFFIVKPLTSGPVMAMGNQAFISIGDAVSYQLSDGSVTASASNAVETGKWSLISVVKEGNSQGATHIYCFGEELQYASTDCSALSTGDIVIGADIAENHLNGDIAEVIIYNTSLTAADRQKVESYLAIKYGITL